MVDGEIRRSGSYAEPLACHVDGSGRPSSGPIGVGPNGTGAAEDFAI